MSPSGETGPNGSNLAPGGTAPLKIENEKLVSDGGYRFLGLFCTFVPPSYRRAHRNIFLRGNR